MAKGNQRNQDDKDEQVERYLRGAARFEERKKNLARRNKDAGGRGLREDLEDGYDDVRAPRRAGKRPAAEKADTRVAVVLGVARTHVRLRLDGVEHQAPISGAVRGSTLAVGDELDVEPREEGPPRLVRVRPRRTTLTRPDPANPHRELVVAANVDVGVIVVAAREPPLRPALIDRYLVALERGGAEALIAVNKVDLVAAGAETRELERTLEPYRALDVPVVTTAATRADGTDALLAALAGRTAVLVGHSGVGKSTLLNALASRDVAAEGAVRAFDGRGRHTTTSSSLHELPGGARVIDTPGVRAFGLAGVTRASLGAYFPGFAEHAGGCRFADCLHTDEPDCAVRAAADAGAFSRERYAVYLRLLESLEGL